MAFDDRYMDWFAATGCLTVLSGLLAPVMNRIFGWWGLVGALTPWLCLSVAFAIFRWREEYR